MYAAAASVVLGVIATAVLLSGSLPFGGTGAERSAPVAMVEPTDAERKRARQEEIYRQAVSRAQVEVVEEAESEFSRLLTDWRQKLQDQLPLGDSEEPMNAAEVTAPAAPE
jgi:hypothetical protein